MSVSIDSQIAFYDWQLREMDLEWAKYHRSNILDLYSANTLYIGRIWGYDDKRGLLILRFKRGKFPRLKVPLTMSYPKSSIGALGSWNYSYGLFREKFVENYSICMPIFYLSNEYNEDYRYVGMKNVSLDFIQHIKVDLEKKTHPIIVLGEEDPPREYLVALRKFTKDNPLNPILNLSSGDITDWAPENLGEQNNLVGNTISILDQSNNTVIQGPPGTGKTHLIAEVCNHYIANNKRVCLAALTHKALIEAALKDGLAYQSQAGKIYKTNLSTDESVLIPKLQNHDASKPIPKGTLLLTSYYSLSKLLMKNDSHVHFDLLVLEEASQAFLATIAGFSTLADKVLVVGDFMQLQPIVYNEKLANNIDSEIFTIIYGLKTFTVDCKKNSYRLVNSHRLTERSAALTGIFYNNSLNSLSSQKGLSLNGNYSDLFCLQGGASLLYLDRMDEGKIPNNAIDFIIKLVVQIKYQYPDKEVAILSAFRDTVNSIIDRMLNINIDLKNLEINTVDRIQGMTVDVCIYLAPSYKSKFTFDDNRFNVATSRAKNGTLIIAEDLVSNKKLFSDKVLHFLAKSFKSKIENPYGL